MPKRKSGLLPIAALLLAALLLCAGPPLVAAGAGAGYAHPPLPPPYFVCIRGGRRACSTPCQPMRPCTVPPCSPPRPCAPAGARDLNRSSNYAIRPAGSSYMRKTLDSKKV